MVGRKCDRCGAFCWTNDPTAVSRETDGIIVVKWENRGKSGAYSAESSLDLCPRCLEDFTNWMASYDGGGNCDENDF